ncbi:TspO/MBR family protein [Roseisolibacter sp. H3M3-2]|uniref:TspO/MBR family protein n=1 Tax=Roseisolibacter sp. H3M3-2 TaxID=3031323 RepID=UPI0023DBE74A|nr:TspO/MBR family protein [Roseisolibacter sp. H3M3-2]MDF1503843.1 tryptophan-rich sensory protein [Roseisolibacter sp. H3M3-2]
MTGTRLTLDDVGGSATGSLALVLCTVAAAALGGVASARAGEFYLSLQRPAWAPPAWVFGPVWTALYILMAAAAVLVWRARVRRGTRRALVLYVAQLALNALWTWLFFAWRNGALAFAEVLVLLALVVATAVAFRRVRRTAALLLLPYIGWVAFASALTWAVWRANPGKL